ncbi:hypothetical protein SNEBB_007237 [Seison nebaliae]|nr:hypothetical protein SNEBB_007237 [Seison nebaliae]
MKEKNIELLEYSTVRMAYEQISRIFRQNLRLTEKRISSIQNLMMTFLKYVIENQNNLKRSHYLHLIESVTTLIERVEENIREFQKSAIIEQASITQFFISNDYMMELYNVYDEIDSPPLPSPVTVTAIINNQSIKFNSELEERRFDNLRKIENEEKFMKSFFHLDRLTNERNIMLFRNTLKMYKKGCTSSRSGEEDELMKEEEVDETDVSELLSEMKEADIYKQFYEKETKYVNEKSIDDRSQLPYYSMTFYQKIIDLSNRNTFNLIEKHIKSSPDTHAALHLKYDLTDRKSFFISLRTHKLIIDYLLSQQCYLTAMKMIDLLDMNDLIQTDTYATISTIVDALDVYDLSPALKWCQENRTKLKKSYSQLEFILRQQEVIEFFRNNEIKNAISHSKKYLLPLIQSIQEEKTDVDYVTRRMRDTYQKELESTLCLMIFNKTTIPKYYNKLVSFDRWNLIKQLFRNDYRSLYQFPKMDTLIALLQMGMSSIKTVYCSNDDGKVGRNHLCATCSTFLYPLSQRLPMACYSNSKLIDMMTGENIDDNNWPMMLPNGYVFGKNTIEGVMDERKGTIRCPKTNEVFTREKCCRVYVV